MKSDYKILVKGPIENDKIQIIFDREFTLKISDIEGNEIDCIWSKIKKRSKERGVKLFDGSLINLISWSQNGKLKMIIGKTRYKYYAVGLETSNSILREKLVSFSPLSISAVTISRDGKVVLGERSNAAFMDQKKIHLIPAGHPDLKEMHVTNSKSINLFKEILREAKEELGINDNNIEKITMLGIILSLSLQKPEIVFQIKLNLTKNEIIKKFRNSKDGWEHKKLHFIESDKKTITSTIKNNFHILPTTKGAFRLYLGSFLNTPSNG